MKLKYKIVILFTLLISFSYQAYSQGIALPNFSLQWKEAQSPKEVALALQILLLLTILTLAPAIVIVVTAFTRIVIVLAFLRQSLGTQQIPPNQIIIALALFLTFFVMSPVIEGINKDAFQPYLKGEISQQVALDKTVNYLRDFMFKQTRPNDLALFINLSHSPKPNKREDVAISVLIPSFIISELKTAFQLGFVIFLPFLIIDLVVASILISMGMLLLPPIVISFPFKLLLFIMVDGWHLIARSLVYSFH
ncbi:MAG: flagellar type III secretion system pore protein FliP [Candidatus Omnitrophica bacterium]|nr:flagellar type III secretion system pore protein FliP [Candidatus Omnitrophota bacterium]